MAIRHDEMLEFTSVGDIKAGYFYAFGYNALAKRGTDMAPVIYCAYAPPDSLNFTGINFHYFSIETCGRILSMMNKKQFILDDDIQHIFNGSDLHECFSNIGIGMKMYNKTRITGSCFRIKNKYIGDFLHIPSEFFMTNDLEKQIQQALEINKNKGF